MKNDDFSLTHDSVIFKPFASYIRGETSTRDNYHDNNLYNFNTGLFLFELHDIFFTQISLDCGMWASALLLSVIL